MAAAESSAGNLLKGGTAAAIQRAANMEMLQTATRRAIAREKSIGRCGTDESRSIGARNNQGDNYLEVVLAAATKVAAGTTVEATTDRVRAYM